MTARTVFLGIFVFVSHSGHLAAQTDELDPFVKTWFTIIASKKTFAEAMAVAGEAATKAKMRVDLRGVGYDPKATLSGGLTFSEHACKAEEWGYPCYLARGRFDSGEYVSIELSDAFDGFTKGYYIVVAASGGRSETKSVLKKLKKFFPDAYNKHTKVYMGCMH